MTTKQHQDQHEHRERAVWLARLPSGRSQTEERHQDRRTTASKLARAHGADIAGEFLISSGEDEHVPEHVWGEVLDFLQYQHANFLVVIRPDEIEPDLTEYYRRAERFKAAGIQLVLPAAAALVQSDVVARTRKKAA